MDIRLHTDVYKQTHGHSTQPYTDIQTPTQNTQIHNTHTQTQTDRHTEIHNTRHPHSYIDTPNRHRQHTNTHIYTDTLHTAHTHTHSTVCHLLLDYSSMLEGQRNCVINFTDTCLRLLVGKQIKNERTHSKWQ